MVGEEKAFSVEKKNPSSSKGMAGETETAASLSKGSYPRDETGGERAVRGERDPGSL